MERRFHFEVAMHFYQLELEWIKWVTNFCGWTVICQRLLKDWRYASWANQSMERSLKLVKHEISMTRTYVFFKILTGMHLHRQGFPISRPAAFQQINGRMVSASKRASPWCFCDSDQFRNTRFRLNWLATHRNHAWRTSHIAYLLV
jgi:hypothetical protein